MQGAIQRATGEISRVLLGKTRQVRLALCCLLSGGHLLLEDLPGMGKTTLAHAMARVLGLEYARVQFTSDLMPSDILGLSIFDATNSALTFQPGPIFTQLLLADEINRATPRAQSALLEAMAEGQVSIDGLTRPLPAPFFVIATQNPVFQAGTYPLPESQLDRFLMRLHLGYPDPTVERTLLQGQHLSLDALSPILHPEVILAFQQQIEDVVLSDSLLDYLQRIIAHTRHPEHYAVGVSPRGALALARSAKAWALMEGRQFVRPDDVQSVLPAVLAHRLVGVGGQGNVSEAALLVDIQRAVDIVDVA